MKLQRSTAGMLAAVVGLIGLRAFDEFTAPEAPVIPDHPVAQHSAEANKADGMIKLHLAGRSVQEGKQELGRMMARAKRLLDADALERRLELRLTMFERSSEPVCARLGRGAATQEELLDALHSLPNDGYRVWNEYFRADLKLGMGVEDLPPPMDMARQVALYELLLAGQRNDDDRARFAEVWKATAKANDTALCWFFKTAYRVAIRAEDSPTRTDALRFLWGL